jgi:hypothetical protein
MSWGGAILGAQVGITVGAALGTIPFVVGCLIREYKRTGIAFVGTLLAGTLGGLYGAIPAMALALATLLQRQDQPEPGPTQWAQLVTVTNKIWWTVAALWIGICMSGAMFVAGAFAEPVVLSVLGYGRKDPAVKLVEPILVFGGMATGVCVGIWGAGVISRNLLSSATHQNMTEAMQASSLNRSRALAWIVRRYYGLLLPPKSLGLRPKK